MLRVHIESTFDERTLKTGHAKRLQRDSTLSNGKRTFQGTQRKLKVKTEKGDKLN